MEDFAPGLFSVFDASLRKLRPMEQRSYSLPDVSAVLADVETISVSAESERSIPTDENTSTSVSLGSVLDDTLMMVEEAAGTNMASSAVSEATGLNGIGELHHVTSSYADLRNPQSPAHRVRQRQWLQQSRRGGGRGGGGSFDSSSDVGDGERERVRSWLSPLDGYMAGHTHQNKSWSDVSSGEWADTGASVLTRRSGSR